MGRKRRSAVDKAEEQEHLERLGQHLRELREAKRLTPQDLADKLGVTPQYIYMVENGKAKPSEKRLNELAAALGDLADEFRSTAIRQVELEFAARLREAGLSAEEIEVAGQRVSRRAKESVVSGKEPLRVARGHPKNQDLEEAVRGNEEVVSLSTDSRLPPLARSASAYAAAARDEFAVNETRGRRQGRAARHGRENISAGRDAWIIVNRSLDDWERATLEDLGRLIARLLDKNLRRKS